MKEETEAALMRAGHKMNQMQKRIDELEKENCINASLELVAVGGESGRTIQKRIDELEQQNAELMAHCEDLRRNIFLSLEADEFENLETVLNRTPKQSLANIKADAIEEASEYADDRRTMLHSTRNDLETYAKKLREQTK